MNAFKRKTKTPADPRTAHSTAVSPGTPDTKRRRLPLGRILVLLIALAVLDAFTEPRRPVVETYVIEDARIPHEFDGLKIVFIADTHAGPFAPPHYLEKTALKMAGLAPDLVLLGGDYVYGYKGTPEELWAPFDTLHPPLGIYAVGGNHDSWERESLIEESMTPAGIRLLKNSTVRLEKDGSSILLGGVPDLWDRDFQDFRVRTMEYSPLFRILLTHNPDYAQANPRLFDLALAGHTHGGQVAFPGGYRPYVPIQGTFESGLYEQGGARTIVTRGIGTVGLPVRFLCRPEISLILLKVAS